MPFKIFSICFLILSSWLTQAQANRWQQKVDYKINFSLNTSNHQFTGSQTLVYTNNSPDELSHAFFHLYFNAFQPGSSMDVRSQWIADPDPRVGDRISQLRPEEYGHLHISALQQDGRAVNFYENETILEVELNKPIAPGGKCTFTMEFTGQVPKQIRRSGRNNSEGIDYSMCQWYPKICAYDCRGWHPNPYIGREFYGEWGNFEVTLSLSAAYFVVATGKLVNRSEVENSRKLGGDKAVTWMWKAENVHDFTWAADRDYVDETIQVKDGPLLHFVYQPDPAYVQTWRDAQPLLARAWEYMNNRFGKYPYDTYSFVQAGDGGMEYNMLTFVTGSRKLPGLVGVCVHEAMHAWYQGALAFDESHFYWMDEGFTSFATQEVMDYLFKGGMPSNHEGAYSGYFSLVKSEKEEAMSTHADHFNTNNAYGESAYSKGEVYLCQLGYIMGNEKRDKALLDFFNTWKMKHPNAIDLLRTMEKTSGLELDWYHEYFVLSTHTIDYAITQLTGTEKNTSIILERKGRMPMPVEVVVTRNDGSSTLYYIPLDLMRGNKEFEQSNVSVRDDWRWVDPTYRLVIDVPMSEIASVEIDPSRMMADVDRDNNRVEASEGMMRYFKP